MSHVVGFREALEPAALADLILPFRRKGLETPFLHNPTLSVLTHYVCVCACVRVCPSPAPVRGRQGFPALEKRGQ